MHGGTRDKWSTLLHNVPELIPLGLVCDKRHEHAHYLSERHASGSYPPLLCRRLAAAFAQHCAHRGVR
eukprot:6468473-Amphidinium_carterae.1